MGLRLSSTLSAVLQRAPRSPCAEQDVQHPPAHAWADQDVGGTNAALSATRRGQAPQLRCGAPQAQGSNARRFAETHPSAPFTTSSSSNTKPAGSPFSHLSTTSPVSCFRPWSAQGRHTMRSEKEAVGQSRARGVPEGAHSTTPGLTASRVPATGPRTSITDLLGLPETLSASLVVAYRHSGHPLGAMPPPPPGPSGTRCRPATCGAERRPACGPAPPWLA